MHLGEETGHICNIVFQELIQNHHVNLFKENVVGQILDDLRNDHQSPKQYNIVFLWYFNINHVRRDNSRRNEALHHLLGRNQILYWFGLTAKK